MGAALKIPESKGSVANAKKEDTRYKRVSVLGIELKRYDYF